MAADLLYSPRPRESALKKTLGLMPRFRAAERAFSGVPKSLAQRFPAALKLIEPDHFTATEKGARPERRP
jgi:hypothetical protein